MLSEQERTDIDTEISHAPAKRMTTIEALRIVQRERGWVSDEAVKDIAEYLEMTPDEVDSVATFYNMIFRQPVGKHVIFVCESISCWVMGYEGIRQKLEQKLGIKAGETTKDGMFTILPVDCLGACNRAPVMVVDEKLHGNLGEGDIDKILDDIRREG
ncbi:MAG TPA: NADH-quinone oxidoreductase subunit NuoE [Spirochaetia bacterium]|nr:NADH-quinone oxidoreductase subunit NuoE [Spirochaetia bacterium]